MTTLDNSAIFMLRMRLVASTEKQQPWICFDFVWAHQHGIADHLTKLESKVHLFVCPGDKDLHAFFSSHVRRPFFSDDSREKFKKKKNLKLIIASGNASIWLFKSSQF